MLLQPPVYSIFVYCPVNQGKENIFLIIMDWPHLISSFSPFTIFRDLSRNVKKTHSLNHKQVFTWLCWVFIFTQTLHKASFNTFHVRQIW